MLSNLSKVKPRKIKNKVYLNKFLAMIKRSAAASEKKHGRSFEKLFTIEVFFIKRLENLETGTPVSQEWKFQVPERKNTFPDTAL